MTKNAFVKSKLVIAIILMIEILSCAIPNGLTTGTKYTYSYKLTGDNIKTDAMFDDGKIQILFTPDRKNLNFVLKNLSSDPMKINWDEAALIIAGESKRVMHVGVKYADRSAPQAPTVIPGNSSITDLVSPTENVYYKEGYYGKYYSSPASWETHDLFPENDLNKPEYKAQIMGYKGQTFRFYLPIDQNGQRLNYTFIFDVNVTPLEAKK